MKPNDTKIIHILPIRIVQFSGLTNSLPRNVQILTLEPWIGFSFLLRLEHVFESSEDAELSQPVVVSLAVRPDIPTSICHQKIKQLSYRICSPHSKYYQRKKQHWELTNGWEIATGFILLRMGVWKTCVMKTTTLLPTSIQLFQNSGQRRILTIA